MVVVISKRKIEPRSSGICCLAMVLCTVIVIIVGESKSLNKSDSNSHWRDKSAPDVNRQVQKPLKDGWHTIQVFYGDSDLLVPNKTDEEMWFSQVNQDKIVSSLLRNKTEGYFIDLAANHAVSLSNTLALERMFNWKGKLSFTRD